MTQEELNKLKVGEKLWIIKNIIGAIMECYKWFFDILQNQKFYYKMIGIYHKLTTSETKHDALLEGGICGGLDCLIEHYSMLYPFKI